MKSPVIDHIITIELGKYIMLCIVEIQKNEHLVTQEMILVKVNEIYAN